MSKRDIYADYNDPDFTKALAGLDKKFPGAEFDHSLKEFIELKRKRKKM